MRFRFLLAKTLFKLSQWWLWLLKVMMSYMVSPFSATDLQNWWKWHELYMRYLETILRTVKCFMLFKSECNAIYFLFNFIPYAQKWVMFAVIEESGVHPNLIYWTLIIAFGIKYYSISFRSLQPRLEQKKEKSKKHHLKAFEGIWKRLKAPHSQPIYVVYF